MTTSEKLMDASQGLAKLSHRAKEAEDHAAAAQNQAKAEVDKSAENARAAAEAHVQELRKGAAAASAQISASRDAMQESLANHMKQVRQSIDEKKGQLDAKHAASRADDAEADALMRSTTPTRRSRTPSPRCWMRSRREWKPTTWQ